MTTTTTNFLGCDSIEIYLVVVAVVVVVVVIVAVYKRYNVQDIR